MAANGGYWQIGGGSGGSGVNPPTPYSLPVPDYSSMPWMQPGFTGQQIAATNAAMPAWLQLNPNIGNQEQQLATQEYLSTQVNPASAQQRSLDIGAGSAQSTFSAARNAAINTLGQRQAMLAGLDAKNAAVDRFLNERSSYNNVPIDQGLAGRLYNNAQNQYEANNSNYQAGQYNRFNNQQNSANRTASLIGAGASLGGYLAPAAGQFASGLWSGLTGKSF